MLNFKLTFFLFTKIRSFKILISKNRICFLIIFLLSGCLLPQKTLNLFYVPPAHKPVNLSVYPHIIPVFSVLRFYCIAHFHCLSTGNLRAGFQFRIFYSCPLAHVQRTGSYSACPLWRFTQTSRSIFPFFQKGILRATELCSRKPAVIITLFTHASSIGNNPRCP